tara:strand:- start:70843 stop:71499 length:657 start_codon:yes stop_codon:yes gene_type:complete
MYLTKINPKTNLVDISNVKDGVLAIKAFADVINNEKFGIEAFTCIALSVDYGSPMRKYPKLERPQAAMRLVSGTVKKFNWNNDLIMEACDVYEQLQFNEDLEEISIIRSMRLEKLAELKDTTDVMKRAQILIDIEKIKKMQQRYSDADQSRFLDESESKKNNYNLSRLENKLKNKNTFYHVRKKLQREREQAERERRTEELKQLSQSEPESVTVDSRK